MGQGAQDLGGDRLGQVGDEVGEVIEVHVRGGGDQFVRVHAFHEAGAHLVGQFHQYLALVRVLDQVEDDASLGGRQRFEQVRGLRRVQGPHQSLHLAHGAGLERRQHVLEIGALLQLGVDHLDVPESCCAWPGLRVGSR